MLQGANKGEVHHLRHEQRDDSNFHRRFNVLARIESGSQHFHHNKPHQPDRIRHQRTLGHRGIKSGKFPVLE
ncbi:Uncharacterised protein [Klebsiella pneumoniae]|nr:Uncharacterised protein [Klebsiella pneumoniae]